MPKPQPGDKPEELDDNIEVVKDERKQEKQIEVSTKPEADGDSQYVTKDEYDKQVKQNAYMTRKMDKLLKQFDSFSKSFNQPQQREQRDIQTNIPDDIEKLTPAQINTIAEDDWQKAVDIRAELKARKLLREEQEKRDRERQVSERQALVQANANKVREKYPELDDDSSEVAKLYSQVLNQDPSLLKNTYGPEIAMYRMEEMMSKNGRQVSTVDSEIRRRERVGAGGYLPGNQPTSERVVMTESEVQAADRAGIPRSEYAKMKKLTPRDFKEGVTVDE